MFIVTTRPELVNVASIESIQVKQTFKGADIIATLNSGRGITLLPHKDVQSAYYLMDLLEEALRNPKNDHINMEALLIMYDRIAVGVETDTSVLF